MLYGEVIHIISNSNDWPTQVNSIANLFSRPLPSQFATGPYPFASLQARRLLPLLQNSAKQTDLEPHACERYPESQSTSVLDVFDIVLSTTSDLRRLRESERDGCPRSTVALWSTLISSLSRKLGAEVSVLEDASFIKPRMIHGEPQKRQDVDGIATMLVCHVLYPEDRPLSTSSMATSIGVEDQDELMSESNNSATSTSSLQVPFDAHLLGGRGRHLSAALPVFVVADPTNITPLMCSVLYQRHTWGIREPAVGIILANTATIGQIVLGWLDDSDCSSPDQLPTPHLAFAATDSSPKLELGVFDLADPLSTFTFSQFVLNLRGHYEDICSAMSIGALESSNSVSWRSDLVRISAGSGEQWGGNVSRWSANVHVQSTSSTTSSPPFPLTPSPSSGLSALALDPPSDMADLSVINEADIEHDTRSRPPTPKKSRGRRAPTVKANLHVLEPDPANRSLAMHVQALSDSGLDDRPSISNWLYERKAFTVGRIKLPPNEAEAQDINQKIELYDRMTDLRWPEAWTDLDNLPPVDRSVEKLREELFNLHSEHIANSGQSTPVMAAEDENVVFDRLSVLLHATEGAYTRWMAAHKRSSNEAERRHDWDALLLKFYLLCSETYEEDSVDTLLERTLNFPRNLAVDSPAEFLAELPVLVRAYEQHCTNAERAAVEADMADDVLEQAQAARDQAIDFERSAATKRKIKLKDFQSLLANHSAKEPDNGKCDTVLLARCRDVSANIAAKLDPTDGLVETFFKHFSLIQHPGPEGKKIAHEAVPASRVNSGLGDGTAVRPMPAGATSKATNPDAGRKPEESSRSSHGPASDGLMLNAPSRHSTSKRNDSSKGKSTAKHHASRFQQVDSNRLKAQSKRIVDLHTDNDSGIYDKDLLLPVLVAEYKKQDERTLSQALNQCRTYCVSSLKFLATLEITDQPVFGLVVNGTVGTILMSWQKGEKIYIMERNVRSYNICDPLQAFHFVTVILRLRRHGKELQTLFKKKKANLLTKLQNESLTCWSKWAQIEEEKIAAAAA
ncbi:hypothetical protein BJ138DRAFT_1228738 [Hygrophoropsis aurantiaca]|uniref:Uncharacterized protein n=1 Tax=Hygrophoropsis aurantiaca TaxID=72124 RepID=A0ACB7ZWN0_9AGAM|nr:hypothetical protein BJ138DRAFT_1228738 [Hygrophoropsis aurantiaca]